jgi:hypothetical protein
MRLREEERKGGRRGTNLCHLTTAAATNWSYRAGSRRERVFIREEAVTRVHGREYIYFFGVKCTIVPKVAYSFSHRSPKF